MAETAPRSFCPRHGRMHDRFSTACTTECSNTAPTPMAPARIAVTTVAAHPDYDGFGLLGALDEWVRWSA